MPYRASILYSNEDDTKFDMKYYLSNHMPRVQEGFKSFGLLKWAVTQYEAGPDGTQPPYVVQTLLVFDNADQCDKALSSPVGQELIADVVNFSNKSPIILGGDVVGASTSD
ncbi:hypothetical protein AUP68_13889 [Ilyonectria robusta]